MLTRFSAHDFRCLEDAALEPEASVNLIYGPNASGKTSLLEAIAYLGRGRSFRGASATDLVRHGSEAFVLHGRVRRAEREISLGVRNGRDGQEIRIAGQAGETAQGLAAELPLQVVDPDVHNLVAGGPDERRRYLDWMAFHVEHDFLDAWRRFRRALRQRNAALRTGQRDDADAWTAGFAAHGERLHAARERVLERLAPTLERQVAALLGAPVGIVYRRGWDEGQTLAEAVGASLKRDRELKTSHAGPHRANLELRLDAKLARRLVSRGQQKLLATGMILAAVRVVQAALARPLLLLLDDPAAELDRGAVERLTAEVLALGSQIVATSLERQTLTLPASTAVFHVEQGILRRES